MWLPDFLLPETSVGFGPVSKIVGGGVGVLLIAMAGTALLPAHAGSGTTLAQASAEWQQQVSDQASQLSAACAKAGQISVSDDVASDADVTAASKVLADVVTDSCAFGTLHEIQQAAYGEVTGSWTEARVTELLNQGMIATTNLTNATNDLSDAVSKAEEAAAQAEEAAKQAQLAAALVQFATESNAITDLMKQAKTALAGGKAMDASTTASLQAKVDSCNAALAADQTSLDAITAAVTTLQGCATDLPNLTAALKASQDAYKKAHPTQTVAPPAPQPPPPTQTQPPVPPTPPTTNPTGRPPSLGKAEVHVDSGTVITIEVYVSDPDHVGYSVCIYDGSRFAGQINGAGTQMVSASIAVAPAAQRDPRAIFC